MVERIKDARPMMDLMAKKVFSNPEITAQFIRNILDLPVHHVKILDGTQIHSHQFDFIKRLWLYCKHPDWMLTIQES